MQYKFKIGDVVKYISGEFGDDVINPLWGGSCGKVKGVVYKILENSDNYLNYHVKWSNNKINSYRDDDLELVMYNFFDELEHLFEV